MKTTLEERFREKFFWLIDSYKNVKATAHRGEDYEKAKILSDLLHNVPDEILSFIQSELSNQRKEIREAVEKLKTEMKIPYQALRFAGGCPDCGNEANQTFIDQQFKEATSQTLDQVLSLTELK